jgi:group I intron endonuclease
VYDNFKTNKLQLMTDHREKKSGIYYFINLINGHCYVGNSTNLAKRMRNYLNTSYLISKTNVNMPINKSLIKYGYDKFSLIIIEYSDLDVLFDRDTFWILKLNPYYKILKYGSYSIGFKHSEATKIFLAELAKKRTHSEETKQTVSASLKGEFNPFYGKNHSLDSLSKIIASKSLGEVYIYNCLKELQVVFPLVQTLANAIKANSSSIKQIIETDTLFRGGWYFRTKLFNPEDTPKFTSYISCQSLIDEIIKNSTIKQAIFLFDLNKTFLAKYTVIIEADTKLGIRHEKLKEYANLKLPYKGYIFSYHRLLD